MRFKNLSESDKKELISRYNTGEFMYIIAKDFGVSDTTISSWLRRLNANIRQRSPTPELVNQWIKEYRTGKSMYRLAEESKFSGETIRQYLLKNNVKLRPKISTIRKYQINETYFDHIGCQRKAYWLGFILADGYCRRQFVVQLANCDRSHLEKLRSDLSSTHPIASVSKRQSRFSISNVHLTKALRRFPVTPKKLLEYPDIATYLDPHFIRGYMDGDGGFYTYDSPLAIFNITTKNFSFLDQVSAHIASGCNVRKIKPRKTSHGSFEIRWNSFGEVKQIFKFLYHEATVWLPRKRERVEHLFN